MEYRKAQTNRENKETGENINVRFFDIKHRSEQRMDGEKPKKVIGGLASVYDKYTDMGWHLEVVRRGFFDGIDTTQTAALKNHDPNLILGRTANGTLTLKDTPDGYDYEAIVPDTQVGRDTYEEVSGGYIYQSSFAFTVTSSVWREVDRSELAGIVDEVTLTRMTYENGKVDIRELVKGGKLYDVSPVTFPAYQSATSEARSLIEERNAFLGNVRQLDERAKVKIEIEVDTSDSPESETPDETPDETTASTRDEATNKHIRLRMAIAKGNTLTQ
jgi:HK97 family phage prohead protease